MIASLLSLLVIATPQATAPQPKPKMGLEVQTLDGKKFLLAKLDLVGSPESLAAVKVRAERIKCPPTIQRVEGGVSHLIVFFSNEVSPSDGTAFWTDAQSGRLNGVKLADAVVFPASR